MKVKNKAIEKSEGTKNVKKSMIYSIVMLTEINRS